MAARKTQKKARDWKLVLADLRRTESEVSELQDSMADFRETLDLARRRLVFIRTCIEKRERESARLAKASRPQRRETVASSRKK